MSSTTLYSECLRALVLAKKMIDTTQTNKKRFGYIANRIYTTLNGFVVSQSDRLSRIQHRAPLQELARCIRDSGGMYEEDQKTARQAITGLFYGIDEAMSLAFPSMLAEYKAADRALDSLNRLPVEDYDLPSLQLMLASAGE